MQQLFTGDWEGDSVDILEYLAIWRRRWMIVAGTALLGVLVAIGVSAFTQREYKAEARLFVTTTGGASVVEAYQGNLFGQERVVSYAQLAGGKQVAQRAIDQLHVNMSADQLMSMVDAEVVPGTVLLDISVTNPNPALAKDLANAVAMQTTQLVEELETSARGGSPAATATLVDEAGQPTSPAAPQWIPNLLFGLLGGVLVGLAAAIVRDKTDPGVRSTDGAAQAAGAPPIGSLPKPPRNRDATGYGSDDDATEAFRAIRTNVLAGQDSNSIGAVVVAEPTARGRGGPVTLGLGAAIAESGRSVIAVEGDFRAKALSSAFGLSDDLTGLSDILAGGASLDDALYTTVVDGLMVLPAGGKTEAASELLAGQSMVDVLKSLLDKFDFVLVSGAPVVTHADSLSIGQSTDGLVLVATLGATTEQELIAAADKARATHVHLIGVVGEHK